MELAGLKDLTKIARNRAFARVRALLTNTGVLISLTSYLDWLFIV